MNWAAIGKFAINTVAAMSVGQVVSNVVEATMPENAGRLVKVSAKVGGFIISAMIGDLAAEYTVNEIDKLISKKN